MLETISAEIIYCRERARLARDKAGAAATAKAKNDHLAAEARWLALARSYELQHRLSKMLGEDERKATSAIPRGLRERAYTLDPDVAAVVSCAFHAVVAELGLSDSDHVVALSVARRIVELFVLGESDPERLKTVVLAWVTK
jgi:hypothetical protein